MKGRKIPIALIVLVALVGVHSEIVLAQEDELEDLFACSEAEDLKRFKLCNICRPVRLEIEDLRRNATDIGLTEDRLRIIAESRLRAARIYTDSEEESNGAGLRILVAVGLGVSSVQVRYFKHLFDPVSLRSSIHVTWQTVSNSEHGGDSRVIIQSVSEQVDKFLVEYLRVNEEHCGVRLSSE